MPLIPLDQLNESGKRYNSWKEKPAEESATEYQDETIPDDVPKGKILGTKENQELRKKMIRALDKEPLDFAYDRAIGDNDSVYSNFVELILNAKRKVGRVVIKSGSKIVGYASGFMVSPELLLTNWHVFKSEDAVQQSEIQFFYELDAQGNLGQHYSFRLNSKTFFHSFKDLDYCFIAVEKMDVTGQLSIDDIGYLFLDPGLGKLGDEDKESLNIIHHPDGDYKQLSIRENKFEKILTTTIWYKSDTAPGSSGSPVLNDQFQVVALHHMGVADQNANGDYLDKKGNIIPKEGDQIDAAKLHWIANEGIRISVILEDIHRKFPDNSLINKLSIEPTPDNKAVKTNPISQQPKTEKMETGSNKIDISIPASPFQHIGILSLEFHVDKLSRPLL